MVEALAEMRKRSAYHQQIEQDVLAHTEAILDMFELIKFHKDVESNIDKLTDESQVLARFEDFPVKKIEALRMAAAIHNKLYSIAKTLENWPLVPPVDKIETYFNEIKGEIETLEWTKDDKAKKFIGHKIHFDYGILVHIKELMVDVSSNCTELTLKERRKAKQKENLWKAFQFAYRVCTFAGGQDDRAEMLIRELAQKILNRS